MDGGVEAFGAVFGDDGEVGTCWFDEVYGGDVGYGFSFCVD